MPGQLGDHAGFELVEQGDAALPFGQVGLPLDGAPPPVEQQRVLGDAGEGEAHEAAGGVEGRVEELAHGVLLLWLALKEASMVLAVASLVSVFAGLVAERWLFFAEARHVVNLFHGAQRC